jgi:hypothetical protein
VLYGRGDARLLLCGDERASELRDHRRIGTVGALVLVDEIARRSEHVEHRREVHGDADCEQVVAGSGAGLGGKRGASHVRETDSTRKRRASLDAAAAAFTRIPGVRHSPRHG